MTMATQHLPVLVLGSNSAVAQVFIELLTKHNVPVVRVTRKECDFLNVASINAFVARNKGNAFSYAVHFATTYSAADVQMAKNVTVLIDGLDVQRLVFMSSWVVMLEDAPIAGTPYIAAKRECERLLREHFEKNPERLRIVRISVAIGDRRLLHDKLLRKLAPFTFLLPSNMRRCFINIHELCAAIQDVALTEGGIQTHCVHGPVRTVAEMATELVATSGDEPATGVFAALAGAIKTLFKVATFPAVFLLRKVGVLRWAMYIVLFWASKLCTYFRGWNISEFAPATQTDLLALVSPHNLPYVQFVGGGAVRNAWGCIEAQRAVVSTRNFNGISAVGHKSVVCKSGTVFKELLDFLAERDLAPTVVPNYSYISIGAAALGPVHGSSLELPLCAQSIGQVKWYNTFTGEIQFGTIANAHREQRKYPGNFVTPALVVLEVEMALSPYHLGTHRYEQTCVQTKISGTNVIDLLRDGSHSNVELRKNITFKDKWSLYTYRLTDANGGPVNHIMRQEVLQATPSAGTVATPPKLDENGNLKLYPKNFTGQVWDLFQKIGFWRSGLWVTNAVQLSSGEMFVTEKDFRQLIDDIVVRWLSPVL